jgi:hypothetical protein
MSHAHGVVGRVAGYAALVAAMAGCQTADVTSPAAVRQVQTRASVSVVAGVVTVCKNGPSGVYNFTVSAVGGRVGTLLLGSSFTLAAGSCVDIWNALPNPPSTDPLVTVTVTEVNLPAATQFDSITFTAPIAPAINGNSIALQVNFFHGAVATFWNSLLPPPPPDCSGLTPGFWKNWKNHYTSAQFLQLLTGTIASGDISLAGKILSTNNPSFNRLRKFVLATQLDLNLSTSNLPNPSGGNLAGTCTLGDGTLLGPNLATALDMLANPGNYTAAQMDAIANILDVFDNLGGG